MKTLHRIPVMLCTFMMIALLFACSKGSSYGGNPGNPNAVSIKNFAFSAATLNVSTGTQVTWTNNDATTHTVTADDASFDSGNIPAGGTFSHTFSSAGTFKYHCSIHPMMTGSVVVK